MGRNPVLPKFRSPTHKILNVDRTRYDAMLQDQDGRCWICQTHYTETGCNLALDHCHESGRVRGLLCKSCNVALGYFKDNPVYLERAMKYLKKFEPWPQRF